MDNDAVEQDPQTPHRVFVEEEGPEVEGFVHDVKVKGVWQQCNNPGCTIGKDHAARIIGMGSGSTFGIGMSAGGSAGFSA